MPALPKIIRSITIIHLNKNIENFFLLKIYFLVPLFRNFHVFKHLQQNIKTWKITSSTKHLFTVRERNMNICAN